MANRYPGYCEDCGREVRANHGELVKRGSKWVVSCGKKRASTPAVIETPKPKTTAPDGMRLTDLTLSGSNASLMVRFGVNGAGLAQWFPGYDTGRLIEYTNGSNADLIAKLTEQGQITRGQYESSFPLSSEEKAALTNFVASEKARVLTAILDGSAEIEVREVGCDFPHLQLCGVKVEGQKTEYALIQDLLREFNLAVDGKAVCQDVAQAIRDRQAAQIERQKKLDEHKAHRAQGFHVVLVRRCWECGRTQILGEYDDQMHVVRMSKETYAECQQEQSRAHARSLATVPEGTILSSVGFDPAPSKFEFRIDGENWYCGC